MERRSRQISGFTLKKQLVSKRLFEMKFLLLSSSSPSCYSFPSFLWREREREKGLAASPVASPTTCTSSLTAINSRPRGGEAGGSLGSASTQNLVS